MKIVTITAARLINTGNFENTRFEACAELADGDDPAAAMAQLQGALARMALAERDRRYPNPERRRYMMWLEEEEDGQA
jgi:hypothetical protein